jgi:hypothetical protein
LSDYYPLSQKRIKLNYYPVSQKSRLLKQNDINHLKTNNELFEETLKKIIKGNQNIWVCQIGNRLLKTNFKEQR